MKRTYRTVMMHICLLLCMQTLGAHAASVEDLRTIYQKSLADEQRARVKSRTDIGEAYETELISLTARLKIEKDTKSIDEIEKELQRYSEKKTILHRKAHGSVSVVANTSDAFATRLDDSDRNYARKVIQLATQYDGALARLQKEPGTAHAAMEERASLAQSAAVVEARKILVAIQIQGDVSSRKVREAAAASTVEDAGSLSMRKHRPPEAGRLFALTFDDEVAETFSRVQVSLEGVTGSLQGRFRKGARLDGDATMTVQPYIVKASGTLALWMNPTKEGMAKKGKARIIGAPGQRVFFGLSGPVVSVEAPYPSNRRLKGVKIEPDKWVHLALTWDSKKIAFYANGELVQSETVSGKEHDDDGRKDSENLRIGTGRGHYSRNKLRGFEGIVDDVMAYDRALTPEQIATLAGK